MVTCWERADLLALMFVMSNCDFVTSPCGILGQVWYLIVLIPDLCCLSYFYWICDKNMIIKVAVFDTTYYSSGRVKLLI